MKTCRICHVEKPIDEFHKNPTYKLDGRETLCKACKKARSAGAVVVADSAAPPEPEPTPITLGASLEVPAGYGVRVSTESGSLWIEQDRADDDGEVYTHQVVLSRIEAAAVLDWISRQGEV